MWNYEDKEDLIENITVRYKYKDDILRMIMLISHKNYKVHFIEDKGFTDEEGNYTQPTYNDSVSMSPNADIYKYEAISIDEIEKEEMEVIENE